MSDIAQLEQLAAVFSKVTSDSGAIDSFVYSMSNAVTAKGAAGIAEAIVAIREAGEQPSRYIAQQPGYAKAAALEQKLRHEDELHMRELARQDAEIRQLNASAANVEAHVASKNVSV
jgi:hypothetical protein